VNSARRLALHAVVGMAALAQLDALIETLRPGGVAKPAPNTTAPAPAPAAAKMSVPQNFKQSAAPAPAAAGATTEQLWLQDTYRFEARAKVLSASWSEEAGAWEVVLDATIFHPQGGGQPSDTGTVARAGGGDALAVAAVRLSAGAVVHVLAQGAAPAEMAPLAAGDAVELSVDEAHRRLAARLHSAGHLIDVAMRDSGVELPPTKGYHFPTGGAYVEYSGKIGAAEREALAPVVQEHLNRLVGAAIPTVISSVDASTIEVRTPSQADPDRTSAKLS